MEQFITFLVQNSVVATVIIALFSLCVGSFINVVVYRLPLMLKREWTAMCYDYLKLESKIAEEKSINLVFPRSYCPQCNKQLSWWHNIPVLSYLFLRGKCAYCKVSISIRYPLVELLTMLLSLLVFHRFGLSITFCYALIFTWVLISLAIIDIDTQLLPDNITIPFLWLGLISNTNHTFISLENAVLSAACAYLVLWSFIKLFALITKKDGMGLGDVKLFAALSAWLGWQQMPLLLLTASLLGSIIGLIILKLTKQGKDTPLAFGQYLCIGGFVCLLYGQDIMYWYLGSVAISS